MQNPEVKPDTKVIPIVIISMTESKQIVVQGPVDKQEFCLSILADAIKIVANHKKEKPMVVPVKEMPA